MIQTFGNNFFFFGEHTLLFKFFNVQRWSKCKKVLSEAIFTIIFLLLDDQH